MYEAGVFQKLCRVIEESANDILDCDPANIWAVEPDFQRHVNDSRVDEYVIVFYVNNKVPKDLLDATKAIPGVLRSVSDSSIAFATDIREDTYILLSDAYAYTKLRADYSTESAAPPQSVWQKIAQYCCC